MEEKSKSERKREMTALQELGKRLLELSREQLSEIGLPQELQDALLLARNLNSNSALRRQMQYIGVLMRRIDPEPVRQAINEIDKGQKRKAREFQQLELMRDRLIEGDDAVFEEIVSRFPDADIQKLRQFVRSARKGKKRTNPLNNQGLSSDIFANFQQKAEAASMPDNL